MKKNWDIALQKTHAVSGARVTLRAELFNVSDDPAFLGARRLWPHDIWTNRDRGRVPATLQFSARIAW